MHVDADAADLFHYGKVGSDGVSVQIALLSEIILGTPGNEDG